MTTEKQIIWESLLDNRYQCQVVRESAYVGTLTITDTEQNTVVYTKAVSLSYEALFGPDMDDVYLWQTLCVNFIDGDNHEQ